MRIYERFDGISLLAGFGCYFMAFGLIVFAPAMLTNAGDPVVTDVNSGESVRVQPYTPEEAAGRETYIDQVCWHCHSQFIRPVNEENLRWGPVSQPGESVIDTPHLYGTRRIGPDLAREGGRRVDDWHYAHFMDPRFTVSASVMPEYNWLFREYADAAEINEYIAQLDSDGDGIVSRKWDRTDFWGDKEKAAVASGAIDNAGILHPDIKQKQDTAWLLESYNDKLDSFTASEGGDGLITNYDSRPRPTERLVNLVKYLQRLGTSVGKWRKWPEMDAPTRNGPPMRGVSDVFVTQVAGQDESGKPVMEDLTAWIPDGVMPLRSTAARLYGEALARATPEEREDVRLERLSYEALMKAWRAANPAWDGRLERGRELYQLHCAGCHGDEGRGNGPATPWLMIRPRDFTRALYRYRSTAVGNMPLDGDLYRSIHRGLPGTSMPPWAHLSDDHIWLLVDYIKHFAEVQRQGERGTPFNVEAVRFNVPPMPTMPASGEEQEEIFLRGRAVYGVMKCVNCHGSTGRGDGVGWNTTVKDNGAAIRPRDLKPRDEKDQPGLRMRGGARPQDLYRTIFTGLSGANMPSSAGDFENGWKNAAKVAALKEAKAPQAEIDAAAKKARLKFFLALGEDLPGVEQVMEDGKPEEYLTELRPTVISGNRTIQFGDDWALMYYLLRLMDPQYVWPRVAADD